MTDLANLSVDEIFKLLESNNTDVVAEIQRFFHENLSETKESWLVSGLYDYYTSTGSTRGLKLLANVREPHEKVLCDRLGEGFRSNDKRCVELALDLLSFIVKRQPTWLHRVAHHTMFKDLLKLIKTENEASLTIHSLLVLVSLLPSVAHKIAPLLSDLFDVFYRLCLFKFKESSHMTEIVSNHLMVAIYAYFHRLYGMFPCNFLYYMRQQDHDCGSSSSVFNDVVAPLLSTVRLHPLLVTQNRDYEKTHLRWKGLAEVHDVIAECTRYSLDVYDASSREEGGGVLSLWTECSTPAPVSRSVKTVPFSQCLDSPPDTAVEATPDNTPYTTPIKDLTRPSLKQTQHVRNLCFQTPEPPSPSKIVTSPIKESSPFRFPELERRDSLFGDTLTSLHHSSVTKRDSLGMSSLRVKDADTSDTARPSPVKFTQTPPKLNIEQPRYNMEKSKLLSLSHDPSDVNKEDDPEVSSITGSVTGIEKLHLSTRHITPQMFNDSADTSRTISRISQESEDCVQQPSEETVSQLVNKVMRRVRRITLCDPEDTDNDNDEAETASMRRSSSCPDITVAISQSGSKPVKTTNNKLRFSSGTQTDPSLNIFSYETLFPHALPLLGLNHSLGKPLPPQQQLLENYIDSAAASYSSTDQRNQIQILRSQLLFETGRRETLGARNRRLLGFTKNVRELEEQNLALVDKLHMARQEIATLQTQLTTVRTGKHKAETDRAESGKLQDVMIQTLQHKLEELKASNRELKENYEFKESELLKEITSSDKAKSELFQTQAKLKVFEKKEESWQQCQLELEKLQVKHLLQGELVLRQKELLEDIPRAARNEESKMMQHAATKEIESLKSNLTSKSQEITALKAKSSDLDTKVTELSEGLKSQQDMIQCIHDEYKEKLESMESRHKSLRSINSHLETTVMELQDRMERVVRNRGKRSGASPSSDCIDVMTMSNVSHSLGSDTGDHIRRALDSPPVNLGREILGLDIPQRSNGSSGGMVGSAYSAVGGGMVGSAHSAYNASNNSHGSQNGKSG